ncbi:hypothetical protein K7I13_09300 [Brucepastera parasyntrophica]|uniref:hypothetical protein n=1 Tax=Brucepastera parasyntrophica TaxID=2880008 RepID=UPI00210C3D17|nr:hypothetical protein [Brucepastera parasyntrophica]ULQ58746.1 hypothetical protein K7I13_09300 [Brucepastera parasyntrophica]
MRITDISEIHSGIQKWEYTVDNGAAKSFTYDGQSGLVTISAAGITAGRHTIEILCTDNAGNTGTRKAENVLFDGTGPVVTADSRLGTTQENAAWTNAKSFSVSAADSESSIEEFSVKKAEVFIANNWTSASGVSLVEDSLSFTSEGIYRITLSAKDSALNVTEQEIYANIDLTNPVITAPQTIQNTTFIVITASDSLSGIASGSYQWRRSEADPWTDGQTAELEEGTTRVLRVRVRDNAGNWSNEGVFSLTVDITPPVITAEIEKYIRADSRQITIKGYEASDTISGVNKSEYRFNTDTFKQLPAANGSGAIILDASSLAEGENTLSIRATDNAENNGYLNRTIILDLVSPDITGILVYRDETGEELLEAEEYAGSDLLYVLPGGADTFRNTEGTEEGEIAYWYWAVTGSGNEDPDENKKTKAEAKGLFQISGFAEGVNYLYLQAEDGSGNRSSGAFRKILVDRRGPDRPKIQSATHKSAKSPQDTGIKNTAQFTVQTANSSSGIMGYGWRLEKYIQYTEGNPGPATVMEEGVIDDIFAGQGGEIVFRDLPDNLEDEYYHFVAWSIGGNGMPSAETGYPFRVDTTPPEGLRVWTYPQTDEEEWYNAQETVIEWNRPADMSGIKEYRYYAGITDERESAAESWTVIHENEVRINLQNLLGADDFTVYIGACAEDYAGNRTFAYQTIKVDYTKPFFGSKNIPAIPEIEDVVSGVQTSKIIRWPLLEDEHSGSERVEVEISDENNNVIRKIIISQKKTVI